MVSCFFFFLLMKARWGGLSHAHTHSLHAYIYLKASFVLFFSATSKTNNKKKSLKMKWNSMQKIWWKMNICSRLVPGKQKKKKNKKCFFFALTTPRTLWKYLGNVKKKTVTPKHRKGVCVCFFFSLFFEFSKKKKSSLHERMESAGQQEGGLFWRYQPDFKHKVL